VNSTPSLSDEKQALLAKMEASRVAYRRMLMGTDTAQAAIEDVRPVGTFPRSHTMRFIQDHPYVVLGALAAVVAIPLLGPRRIARTARTTAYKSRAATSVVMRNQNRIRLAITLATAAARFISQRRHR
jgi:hypothetical protein